MKRILCLFVLICGIMSFMPAGAYAEKDYSPYVFEVEISAGDTISDICDSYGIDYYAVRDAIMIVNGFQYEKEISAVRPGQKILLPRSGSAADSVRAVYETNVSAIIPREYVVTVKVEKGETLYGICDRYGLTYSICKDAIKSLNMWSGDFRLERIQAGQEIILPSSDSAAVRISAAVKTAVEENVGVNKTPSDKLEYYLISHRMEEGETVRTVCAVLNVRYSEDVAAMLRKINSISDLGMVRTGEAYLFPSKKPDGAVYAVYSHVVESGETVYSVCERFGVNSQDIAAILGGLNPRVKIESVQKGYELLVAVPCKEAAEIRVKIK